MSCYCNKFIHKNHSTGVNEMFNEYVYLAKWICIMLLILYN